MLDITKFNLKSQYSGFALLYNPVSIGKNENVVIFDAQVDMSPAVPDANNIIKGIVRYYKSNDHRESPQSGQFFVNMKVRNSLAHSVQPTSNLIIIDLQQIAHVPEAGLTVKEGADTVEVSPDSYDFMGDINMVRRQFSGPISFHLTIAQFFDTPQLDETKFRPLVDICGVASNINRQNATFTLQSSQYLQLGSRKLTFPAHAVVPDSPKFQNIGKDRVLPPSENTYVSITGILTRVITKPGKNGEDGPVESFCVDIESTSNLGRPPPSSTSKETPVQLKSTAGSKRKRVEVPAAANSIKAPRAAVGISAGTSARRHQHTNDAVASGSGSQETEEY
ncbi:hypothetical protein PQX77_021477 [Marasmius sp. AFHP31]|nr:hypothetical protein PQX77_021477 [Marasmius sp. AFHP31]